MKIKIPFILIGALAISCNNPIRNSQGPADTGQSGQKVKDPQNVKLYMLPSELNEISGITFLNNDIVITIQDEDGILYEYNIQDEKITKKIKFGEDEDYEDLVRINKDIYVVISNGTIIQIKNFESATPEIKKFKTPLTKENDIEGLAYEPAKNRLLLAAKAKGMDEDENTKEIYGFDLTTMKLETKPAYTIRLNEIESYFKGDALVESSKKLLKAFGNQNINKVFRSSAITVNPQTNQIYVLSSINNLIAVLNPDGKITQMIQFDGKEYTQPEGLAFSENGKLYVSNEAGKNGKGNIIELEYAN